jgi:hypothetical protein
MTGCRGTGKKEEKMNKFRLIFILLMGFLVTMAILLPLDASSCKTEGQKVAEFKNVAVYANGCDTHSYWQCVEFAKRFYFLYHHFDVVGNWKKHGNTYHDKMGLAKYDNKIATILPRIGDTLAFGTTASPHVAIVSEVNPKNNKITFYQQNWSNKDSENFWETGTVTYTENDETGSVTINKYGSYKVVGWGSPRYSVPLFSQDGNTYDAVYGVINKPIYAKITALNDSDSSITFDSIGIGGRGPLGESDIRDISIQNNYIIESNKLSGITGNNTFGTEGDYQFFTHVQKDGNDQLENVVKRRLIFTLLEDENSIIVDESEINNKFFCSNPIGIENVGWVDDPKYHNLKPQGYLYGSILVNSDSKSWAQWKPKVEGKYAIEIFVPENGCNALVQYKIKPDGTDENQIMSDEIDQNQYCNVWVPLQDVSGETTWDFTKEGYVGLFADFAADKKVGFDAVKFIYQGPAKELVSVSISGPSTIYENGFGEYQATAEFSDGSTEDVTSLVYWTEDSPYTFMAPQIKNRLVATEITEKQKVNLYAEYNYNGITEIGHKIITLKKLPPSKQVKSITISGPSTMIENSYQDYTAVAEFVDGASQDITSQAYWITRNKKIVSFDPVIKNRLIAGEVSKDCRVIITVSYIVLRVPFYSHKNITILNDNSSKKLTSLKVIGPSEVEENSYGDYKVRAKFSDHSLQWVTGSVTWSENSPYIHMDANIKNRMITGEVPSNQQIMLTATYVSNGITYKAYKYVDITDISSTKTLTSLMVSGPPSVNENSYADYSAAATFSDGSSQVVTASASWAENSSHADMDTVIKGRLITGEVSSNQTITVTATYTYNGVTKNANKNVTIIDTNPLPPYSIVGDNPTTNGWSYWEEPLLKLEAIITGTTLKLIVTKIGGMAFESSGTVYFKVGTYEPWGFDRKIDYTIGDVTMEVVYEHDLSEYSGQYPKEFYVRHEPYEGGFSWVGPITVVENNN